MQTVELEEIESHVFETHDWKEPDPNDYDYPCRPLPIAVGYILIEEFQDMERPRDRPFQSYIIPDNGCVLINSVNRINLERQHRLKIGERTLRANTYWQPYFPWICFCLNFFEEQFGLDRPLAKEILSYFKWRTERQMQKLNTLVRHEKRKYYKLHWRSLKQKVFAKDQLQTIPTFKSLCDVRVKSSDFNMQWEPIVQPTFGIPRTLFTTVHPIKNYRDFHVTRESHIDHLAPYLPHLFWEYLERADEDPIYEELTGHEENNYVITHHDSDDDWEPPSPKEFMNIL
jgi:hypothetical protein